MARFDGARRLPRGLSCFAAALALAAVCFLAAPGVSAQTAAPAAAATPAAAPNAAAAPSPWAATDAKDIAGTWQGTLHVAQANRDLRIVNKITKDGQGKVAIVFYSIDQGGMALPASKSSFEGGVLKYSIDLVSGTYEGKMSADGQTIAGTWTQGQTIAGTRTQGPNPTPLVLTRTTPDTAWAIPEPEKPMAADANPSLDVATIKPSDPSRQGKGFGFRGAQFMTFNTNLNDLIAFAYGVHAKQIIGAPDWFGTDLFDIAGKPDTPGRPNIKQMGMMMQKLLADRCALKFHHEQRELSVYAVRVASGGPKMTKSTAGPNDPGAFFFRGLGDLVVRDMTMANFATWMQASVMDKPIVDQTGLTDHYDFTLKWTPDDSQFAQFRGTVPMKPASDDPNAPPSLYTAMQEQLGLKMDATKAVDDVIVIDHVEKPSPN